jgi:DNA processing protein
VTTDATSSARSLRVRPDVLDPRDTDPTSREHLRDWLALHAAYHLDPVTAVGLLEHDVDAALAFARRRRPRRDPTLDERIEVLAQLSVRALPWASNLYPDRLRTLPDASPLLFVRGEPAVMLGRAVAIVGARAPTVYGLETARRLSRTLAAAGVVVVSGLARGIDGAAHRSALEAGGLSLAFSACGPDQVYPAEHADLADEVAAAGAFVTEMPPGTPPLPHYFPLRNRLISGVSEIVVVVEGRLKSGSLVTARKALDQGREVMAVPGPIGAPTSAGPNRLLRDGATPMTEIADVFRVLDLPLPDVDGRSPDPVGPRPLARRILASLRREPGTRDELAVRLALPPGELALELMELELGGRVATDRDGRLRVVGGR